MDVYLETKWMFFLEGVKVFSSGEGAGSVRRREQGGMVVKRGVQG